MKQPLDLRLLQAFILLVETGSVSETARRTGRTQPAVSLQMRRLEETVQAQLFTTVNRKLVLTPDGEKELGCVYVRPSSKPGYDAQVMLWVTQEQFDAGFDETLYFWTKSWVEQSWPFSNVAYPGREIDWATWDQL